MSMQRSILTVLTAFLAATAVWAQPATQPVDDEEIIYRPPTQNAPAARMGGGSRGDVKLPTIEAIVPDHAGATISSQPALYWFCSEATELPREFSLVDSVSLDTIKRQSMKGAIEAGWQKIDLKELGVSLEPGRQYEWRVAVIASTTNRSDNAVAGGMIQYVVTAPPPAEPSAIRQAAMLAQAGVWYDAVDTLMTELAKNPSNAAAAKALAALFSQVKLEAAGKFLKPE